MDERTRRVMHSSENMNWRTPGELFKALDLEFNFDFDAAADEKSHLVENYASEIGVFTSGLVNPDLDGLSCEWGLRTFCNPPYGRGIGRWFEKAAEEANKGKTCVLLVPARTDTAYWHDFAMKADEIRLVRGRIKFLSEDGNATNSAPFPSAVVVFRKRIDIALPRVFSWTWKD